MSDKITPVLLGADLNAYNVARAFHEAYGFVSYAFGRYGIGATLNSKIIKFTSIPDIDSHDTMIKTLHEFAKEHENEKLILLGCTDDYVSKIIHYKDEIGDRYIMPYIDSEKEDLLTDKSKFYEYCEEFGIPYPKTKVISSSNGLSDLPFDYPIIIKPSVSASYWKHEFEGMKKVYRAKDFESAKQIVDRIYGAGYPDKLVVQDTIPGDDSEMYVLTCYSDRNGKVIMACLGHVLLEEHTPKGLGNHCAIVTEYNPELVERFIAFLEKIGYTGFSNFDIKHDRRDNSFRAFEINTRQGRSNYYVTATGNNIARLIVEDRIEKKDKETVINDKKIYWRYIPDSIVKKYVSGKLYSEINKLKKEKKAFSSMRYGYDLKGNFKRRIYVMMHEYRHHKKFKTFYHPENNNVGKE